MAKKLLLELARKLMERGSSRSSTIPGRRSTAKEADDAGIIVGKERVARYGRNERMKGAGKAISASEAASLLPSPDIEESSVVDSEGRVNTDALERGRIKPKLRGYKGPEAAEDMEEKKRGGMVYRMKGGKVGRATKRGIGKAMSGAYINYGKPMKEKMSSGGKVGMRGCGKALRGYGKAMKGK